jgi:hypothetical protein
MQNTVTTARAALYKCKHLPLKLRGRKQAEGDRKQGSGNNVWI